MTLNAHGIRESAKVLDLHRFMIKERVETLMATETRLTREELRKLYLPPFLVACAYGHVSDVRRMRGGVDIFVCIGLAPGELGDNVQEEEEGGSMAGVEEGGLMTGELSLSRR